jgi:ankyrin repeat protein
MKLYVIIIAGLLTCCSLIKKEYSVEGQRITKTELIEKLRDKALDPNANLGEGNSLLHLACDAGDLDIVSLLVELGANINAQNSYDATPLGHAVLKNHYQIAELLLQKGADPHSLVTTDTIVTRTVLAEAIFQGNEKMIALLKKYGANINHQDKDGRTDLHRLAHYNSIQVEKLLKAGIDPNILDNNGYCTAFFYLPSSNQVGIEEIEKIVKLLQKYGASINEWQYHTPLFAAVERGDMPVVEILIKNGAFIEGGGGAMKTVSPLHMAVELGNFPMVQFLAKKGAALDTCNYWNITPLMSAAGCGEIACKSAPTEAEQEEYLKIAEFLIANGADVNQFGRNPGARYEENPLLCAARANFTEMVKFLLKNGAEVNVKNAYGKTPLELARKARNTVMENCLIEHGAK